LLCLWFRNFRQSLCLGLCLQRGCFFLCFLLILFLGLGDIVVVGCVRVPDVPNEDELPEEPVLPDNGKLPELEPDEGLPLDTLLPDDDPEDADPELPPPLPPPPPPPLRFHRV
jgi:hypothetical protein